MIQKTVIHFLLVTLILILNLLMLVKLRNIFKSKRRVLETSSSNATQDRVRKSESRNTFMLIWTSPVTIIPNYMNFVINILSFVSITGFYNPCLEAIGNVVFELQFVISFVFYYSFNMNFKTVVHQLIAFRK